MPHMRLRVVGHISLALSLSVAVGLAVHACSDPELAETPGEKEEWSALQAINLQMRNVPLAEPVVRRVFDRDLLGVKGASEETVWIMLRPASPPFYKQMPQGQYDLPAALVERLRRERRLSYTVDAVLRSHVREE
jgi:hypothetical protein